jgi:hypothetical protein
MEGFKILKMFLALFASFFFHASAQRPVIHVQHLSRNEQLALFHAEKMIAQSSDVPKTKQLLCSTFISLRNKNSERNLVENIKYAKEKCDWVVVSYNAVNNEEEFERSVSLFEETARASNTKISVLRHSFGNIDSIMKPLMFDALLPHLESYSKVWLMDEDISIVGFDFRSYFGIWNCAFDQSSPAPVISQPLISGGKYLPPFSADGWTMYNRLFRFLLL